MGSSWNPIAGCSVASVGCENCYAKRLVACSERTMRLIFTVPGPPVPCARARVVHRPGCKPRGVTPDKTRAYEVHVANCALEAVSRCPHWRKDLPAYSVTLRIYREAKRGDWDNYGKGICDGMRHIVYGDDAVILDAHVRLRIDRVNPRAEIEVEPLEEEG